MTPKERFSSCMLVTISILWCVSYFNVGYVHQNSYFGLFGGCFMWEARFVSSLPTRLANLERLKTNFASLKTTQPELADHANEMIGKLNQSIQSVQVTTPYSWHYHGFRNLQTAWLPRRTPSAIVPLWIAMLPFAVMVACERWTRYLTVERNLRRCKLGLCVKCGYDLRASYERCPECGTAFQKS